MGQRAERGLRPWQVELKVILNAVDYKGRDRNLDFTPDPEIVVPGVEEIALMEAERRNSGKFTG